MDQSPEATHLAILTWSHVHHVIYYAPHLCSQEAGLRCGVVLQRLFRAGGLSVETIAILTDENMKEEVWASLEEAWMKPFGTQSTDTASPPVLKRMYDARTVQKAQQLASRVGRPPD